jgi:hypothetical protein
LELIVQHFVAGVSFEWENFAVGSWVTNHAFFALQFFWSTANGTRRRWRRIGLLAASRPWPLLRAKPPKVRSRRPAWCLLARRTLLLLLLLLLLLALFLPRRRCPLGALRRQAFQLCLCRQLLQLRSGS